MKTEDFEMSMISEQIKKLRAYSDSFKKLYFCEGFCNMLYEAADTIETLSAKLAAANMDRSDRYYCGGWIYCTEWMPSITEYSYYPQNVLKRLEIAYMTDTMEYTIGYFDGDKWILKNNLIIENVVAWRKFLPLQKENTEPYRSQPQRS